MLEHHQVVCAHFSRAKNAFVNIFVKLYIVWGGFLAVSRDSFMITLMFNTYFLGTLLVIVAEGKRIVPISFKWIIVWPLSRLLTQI